MTLSLYFVTIMYFQKKNHVFAGDISSPDVRVMEM